VETEVVEEDLEVEEETEEEEEDLVAEVVLEAEALNLKDPQRLLKVRI
jgi:hypothetical protein